MKGGCCRRSPRSIAADLRVTQTVDGNKGIHCVLPRAKLPPRR
jgi:acetamidase/formamidase